MSIDFEQIRSEPAYRKVSAALLERITDRRLAPGDRLPSESELARRFGVNRSTVREALRELESTGLLRRERGSKLMMVTRPEHGFVADGVGRALALHDVSALNVWEALTVLEPPIAEAAARRRLAGDLAALRESAARYAARSADTLAAAQAAADFLRKLGEASHNRVFMLAHEPLLQLLVPSICEMIDRVAQARGRIATAHVKISESVAAKDPAGAASWTAKHIRDFRRGYELAGIDLATPIALRRSTAAAPNGARASAD